MPNQLTLSVLNQQLKGLKDNNSLTNTSQSTILFPTHAPRGKDIEVSIDQEIDWWYYLLYIMVLYRLASLSEKRLKQDQTKVEDTLSMNRQSKLEEDYSNFVDEARMDACERIQSIYRSKEELYVHIYYPRLACLIFEVSCEISNYYPLNRGWEFVGKFSSSRINLTKIRAYTSNVYTKTEVRRGHWKCRQCHLFSLCNV